MGRRDVEYFKPTEKGYEYVGKYYRFRINGPAAKNRNRNYGVLSALMLVIFIAMGFLDRGLTYHIYVALPYVASLLPIGLCIAGAFALPKLPDNMTIVQYKRGPKKIIGSARAILVTGAMTCVGVIIAGMRGAFAAKDIPFAVGGVCICLCAIWVIRMYRECPAEEVAGRPEKTIIDPKTL